MTNAEQVAYYYLSAIAHRHSLRELDLAHRCELRAFELERYGTAMVHHGYRELPAEHFQPVVLPSMPGFQIEHLVIPEDLAGDVEIVDIDRIPVRSGRL